MFKVIDKNGDKLYIKDKILHEYDEGPDTVAMIGIVISFPYEGKVQYQPTKYADGNDIKDALPKVCDGSEVKQMDSLARRALELKGHEDFQQLLIDARQRYEEAVERNKKKKAGTRGGRTKTEVVQKDIKVINNPFL